MHQFPHGSGWIEVICGSMFSGKTEELIRRLKRALYGKQKIQVFKPQIDAFAALGAYTPGSYSWMDPEDHGKRMHIDYCFVSCGHKDRLKSAVIDTDSPGSDHFPLRVEIGD